jgi:GT2 family glycosyltransferase
VSYELIVVDNGSKPDAASYADAEADRCVLNTTNLGFARGMNQGLALATGTYIAFCNNDTVLPTGWASRLLESAARQGVGIVVPAVTAATNRVTVRSEPGTAIEVLPPFSAPPSGVVYVMRTDIASELGGWSEEYEIASAEDVDLAFKVWVNDLDVVYDQRVLVNHFDKATSSRLPDWRRLWVQNRWVFLEKWTGVADVPRLRTCDERRHERNRATARATAEWMAKYFAIRDGKTVGPQRRHWRTRKGLRR